MSLETQQDAIDALLGRVPGLTATPNVLVLSVPTKELPAATSYFAGYETAGEATGGIDERKARFRIDIEFLLEPSTFKATVVSIIRAIHNEHAADRDLGETCVTSYIEDGGEFQLDSERASATVAIKTLYIVTDTEEVT